MDYVPPVGGAPGAPYIDGNPGTGTEGSAVPAASVEHGMREIVQAITDSGLVPSGADLTQLSAAISALARDVALPEFQITENSVINVPNGNVATLMNNMGTVDRDTTQDSTLTAAGITIGAKDAGLWLFTARANVNVGDSERISIYVNAAEFTQHLVGSGVLGAVPSLAAIIRLADTDTVELYYTHNDTTAQNTTGANIMAGVRLGG